MTVEQVEVVVVGGGQAGIAMSEHLGTRGIGHVVLERHRVAERWRSERWDSLVANGPAWHDRFPGRAFDLDPDAFASKEQVAAYLSDYAEQVHAPIRTGVEVLSVRRHAGRPGFLVATTGGDYHARYVVAATGAFQKPVVPDLIPAGSGIHQLHSSAYRNPDQLAPGGVLVVGSGSSGVQIASEVQRSGRQVYLSVGPHERPPRRYRGRDFCWWLGVLGKWELAAPPQGAEHVTIAVSGADGGRTVDLRDLADEGIVLVGRSQAYDDGVLRFANDLAKNLHHGDAGYLALLDEADQHVLRNGTDLPEEPEAKLLGPDPDCVVHPLTQLDLRATGVTSVVWATGFTGDYGWLPNDALDERGRPKHQRGVSAEPGIYFLGLPWQSRRGSSFIWGVWHDAQYLADAIDIQRGYLMYDAVVAAEGAAR